MMRRGHETDCTHLVPTRAPQGESSARLIIIPPTCIGFFCVEPSTTIVGHWSWRIASATAIWKVFSARTTMHVLDSRCLV